jgi:hypothetical protein
LTLGITEILPEWEIILRQIGLSFQQADTNISLTVDALPVLIVSSAKQTYRKPFIQQYLRDGGAVLTEADIAQKMLNLPIKRVRVKYLYSESDEVFSNIPLCDLAPAGRRLIIKKSEHLQNQAGERTVAIQNFGKGKIIVLPSGFCSGVLNNHIKRKNFPLAGGERFPSERISLASKGIIRNIVRRALEYLYHFRRLPFMHLWHLPNGAEGLFGFRVDTDFGSREEVDKLYRICDKNNIRATWFVETKSQATWINVYREIENQEIGYHCYRHRIFPDYQSNLQDIQTGLKILKGAGFEPSGYAAPYGEWNPVLGKIIQDLGFNYSSEFTAGYDDLPFYPFLQNSFSSVLQVPIHPISIGRLRWSGHKSENMIKYYLNVIEEKSRAYEPIFLYHHPGHLHFEVFDQIFQEINRRRLQTISLGEYATWWQHKAAVEWEGIFENNRIVINSKCSDESIWLKRSLPSGETMLTPLNNSGKSGKTLTDFSNQENIFRYNPKQLRKYHWQMTVADILGRYGKWKQ